MAVVGSLLLPFAAGIYDNEGDPLSGGLVYFYVAGTATPQNTYADALMTTANANPVVLDAYGRATIFIDALAYLVSVKTSAGVLLWDEDNLQDQGQRWLASSGTGVGAKAQATGYTVVAGDVVVTMSEAAVNPAILNLPTTVGWYTELTIKNVGANPVSITPSGTQLLEGLNAVYTLPAASGATKPAITLKAHALNWYIVGSHKVP